MPGSVHHLDGRERLVAVLERWTERARKGELDAVALAAQVGDGVATEFYVLGNRGNVWMLAGALSECQYRLMHDGVQQPAEHDGNDDQT